MLASFTLISNFHQYYHKCGRRHRTSPGFDFNEFNFLNVKIELSVMSVTLLTPNKGGTNFVFFGLFLQKFFCLVFPPFVDLIKDLGCTRKDKVVDMEDWLNGMTS